MILNITYNFLNNINDKIMLNVVLNNIKLYLISFAFYSILYLIILYTNIKTLKKIFYIIFLVDLISLVINIISTSLPENYNFIDSIKRKISLYKK